LDFLLGLKPPDLDPESSESMAGLEEELEAEPVEEPPRPA
jgi:hypothetical protein